MGLANMVAAQSLSLQAQEDKKAQDKEARKIKYGKILFACLKEVRVERNKKSLLEKLAKIEPAQTEIYIQPNSSKRIVQAVIDNNKDTEHLDLFKEIWNEALAKVPNRNSMVVDLTRFGETPEQILVDFLADDACDNLSDQQIVDELAAWLRKEGFEVTNASAHYSHMNLKFNWANVKPAKRGRPKKEKKPVDLVGKL